jgi:hypothetical protein
MANIGPVLDIGVELKRPRTKVILTIEQGELTAKS